MDTSRTWNGIGANAIQTVLERRTGWFPTEKIQVLLVGEG